jgi:hypothetical protein
MKSSGFLHVFLIEFSPNQTVLSLGSLVSGFSDKRGSIFSETFLLNLFSILILNLPPDIVFFKMASFRVYLFGLVLTLSVLFAGCACGYGYGNGCGCSNFRPSSFLRDATTDGRVVTLLESALVDSSAILTLFFSLSTS